MGVWSGWGQGGQGQLPEGGEEFGACSGAKAACGALQAFLAFPSVREEVLGPGLGGLARSLDRVTVSPAVASPLVISLSGSGGSAGGL